MTSDSFDSAQSGSKTALTTCPLREGLFQSGEVASLDVALEVLLNQLRCLDPHIYQSLTHTREDHFIARFQLTRKLADCN